MGYIYSEQVKGAETILFESFHRAEQYGVLLRDELIKKEKYSVTGARGVYRFYKKSKLTIEIRILKA